MKKPRYSLKLKLSFSYAIVALLLVAAISLFSNFFFQKQFEQYIMQQQEQKNRDIVTQLSLQYNGMTRSYSPFALETIGVTALEQGMIIRVTDASGAVLWDATVHNNGFCNQMLAGMAADMQSRYPNFEGAYEEKSYPVINGNDSAGEVVIGYYGPFYFSENDAAFIATLNRILLGVGAVSLLFAVFLGMWMARRISSPVAKATDAAEKIAKGDYSHKIGVDSGTKELYRLLESINSLSAELANQDHLRKRLTRDIAHELRTPLAALQGNMEALIDGVWQPDQRHFISCHEEILRLTRLVSDLERLAELEDDRKPLEKSVFEIKELCESTVEGFRSDFLKKNLAVSVEGEAGSVSADRDKLRQVLVNLLSNSLKYTPAGGKITVFVSGTPQKAAIRVEDTGTGISEEELPFIFQRFYRTDSSRSSRSGGAGIGLAIVKTIVELHGGALSAESEAGKGTAITVTLPRG